MGTLVMPKLYTCVHMSVLQGKNTNKLLWTLTSYKSGLINRIKMKKMCNIILWSSWLLCDIILSLCHYHVLFTFNLKLIIHSVSLFELLSTWEALQWPPSTLCWVGNRLNFDFE